MPTPNTKKIFAKDTLLLCVADWDDLLAYKTESKVYIRHKTVGGFYYFVMFYGIIGLVGYVLQLCPKVPKAVNMACGVVHAPGMGSLG